MFVTRLRTTGYPRGAFGQDDVIDRDSMVRADARQNTRELYRRTAEMHNTLRPIGAKY